MTSRDASIGQRNVSYSIELQIRMAMLVQHLMLAVTVCLTCLQIAAAQPQDNEASLDGPRGLKVFVGRKGGTIRLYRHLPRRPLKDGERKPKKEDRDKKRRSGEIGLSFGRIQEVDSSSTTIKGNHGVRKPKDIDFSVNTEMDRSLQRAGDGRAEIRGDCLDCQSSLKDASNAGMTLIVCVVKTNGTMILGDEQSQVMEGQLKFSVRLDKWPWAQNGRSVDVDVVMKVPPGRAIRRKNNQGRGRPVAFELGADASAYFSTKVNVDGSWKDMEDGYPKFDNKGANNIVTLRIPRFSNYALYDPTVETGYESGSRGHQASVFAIFASLFSFVTFSYY